MLADSLGPFAALFGAAFLAATLVPAQSELLLAYLLTTGEQNWMLLLVVATAGNVLGSIVNWFLGRSIERYRDRRWFPVSSKALDRAERGYARWGKWSLLLSWVPIIGDPMTLVAGLLRTPFPTFVILVLIAKGGRYGAIALGVAAAASSAS
jgi:membrane protein YqaA with SNARE-associated domain